MNDFSQWGEQTHILQYFGPRTGRFLDLGAHDGVHLSNTRALALLGWQGVLVEADPERFVQLLANCRAMPTMTPILGAIAPMAELAQFSDIGSGCGALDSYAAPYTPEQMARFRSTYGVATFAPGELARYAGTEYQMVSIDIEGADPAVLESIGCLMASCELLVVEDAKPGCDLDPLYRGRLHSAAARYGLTRVLWSSTIPGERNANTILVRG